MMQKRFVPRAALIGFTFISLACLRAAELPDPDGKPADMSKPVEVFLILGQSNAVGLGSVAGDKPGTLEHAVKTEKLYPFLVDDAGKQWDDDIANAKSVLSELDKHYPGAKDHEVAGFFWWHGEKDAGNSAHAELYEQNLVHLIKTLRQEFNAPDAKFVMGTIGEVTKETGGNSGKILEAMMARGGSGNGHYSKDSRVYMDVGLAMSETMNALFKSK